MDQIFTDIWKILLSAALAAIGWLLREGYSLKSRVLVLEKALTDLQDAVKQDKEDVEKSIRHLQENVAKDIDNIRKDIEKIHTRQDSHSKKQDEIVKLLTDFKLEMVKYIGELSSDVKALNSTIEAYDEGIKIRKKK